MKITIRNDSVEILGYVNSTERLSKPLWGRSGRFTEKVMSGCFGRAIERNDDIKILLNHDWNKQLGTTKDGTLELVEDNIGLRAKAIITDSETIEKAKNGDLVGWSFGFRDVDVENGIDNDSHLPMRNLKDIELYEVSILDRSKTPAYNGTLVSVRSEEEEPVNISDDNEEEIELVTETEQEQAPVEDAEKPLDAPVEDVEETTLESVEDTTEDTTDENTIPSEDYFTEYKELISKLKEIVKEFE